MRKLAVALIVTLISISSIAFANATKFSIVDFYPVPDGGEYLSTQSSTSLYKLQWHAGTMADYAYRPLIENTSDRKIVNYYLMQHFYGAIGFTDWLSFGFDLPVAWINRFSDPDTVGAPFENKLDLADPKFQFKVRLLDRAYYPVGLAIVPFMTAPLGKEDRFMGDEGVTGGGIITVDTEFKRRLWLALNAGVSAHKYVTWRNVDQNAVSVLLGLGAAVRATDELSFSLDFNTKTPTNHLFTEKVDSPTELLGGVKYNIGKTGLQLTAGGGVGLVRGVGAPTARGLLGISYKSTSERTVSLDEERVKQKYVELKTKEQKEIEKVISLRDKCPSDPSKFKAGIDNEGCPKYYELKEVADLIAKCPTKAEDFDPAKHSEACNKVYTLTDKYGRTDAEVVYVMSTAELAMNCPSSPASFDPKIHDQGCPKYYELRDVTPLITKCPSDPKKFNPKVNDESCPKVYELKDSYEEENWMTIARLAKKDMAVPAVAVVATKAIKANGETKVVGEEIVTTIPITFKFNSYEITDESAQALGELAEKLIENPNLRNIRIEGYSDPIGPKAKNKIYSLRRAEAVKNYLELHGVDTSKMNITAYGPTSKFEGGYPANRRVIFLLEK